MRAHKTARRPSRGARLRSNTSLFRALDPKDSLSLSLYRSFLDSDLEDLIEIGGDPTFLEQARDVPKNAAEEEWDGTIDEAAYFDD